jgi:hypothetical protein
MFLLKILIVGIVALLAIVLGAMAAAWRRACVAVTRHVHTMNWMAGDGSGSERPTPPGPEQLSNEDVIRFTPRWVSARHMLALAFLALTLIVSLVLLRWYIALAVGFGTYLLMELSGFLLPRRDHPYYVRQIYDSFLLDRRIATHFAKKTHESEHAARLSDLTREYETRITEMESRLSELSRAYPDFLLSERNRDRAHPQSVNPSC